MNRRVLAAVSDMLFASKIRGTAEHLNVTVEFARGADALFDAAKTDVPSLIILDLHATHLDPFALAARLKADDRLRGVPIVAFLAWRERNKGYVLLAIAYLLQWLPWARSNTTGQPRL